MPLIFTRDLLYYYGFIGHNNIGDEAIWEATKQIFAPKKIYSKSNKSFSLSNKLLSYREKKLLILGGGTLIGDNLPSGKNPFRDDFLSLSENSENLILFGTGVGEVTDNIIWLSQWKPILDRCDYIGVRGPLSKKAIAGLDIRADIIGDPACFWVKNEYFYKPKNKCVGVCVGSKPGLLSDNCLDVIGKKLKNLSSQGWCVEFFVVNPEDINVTDQFITTHQINVHKIHYIYESTDAYLNAVRYMTFFIGTRLHSVILAMCAGVPSLMVEYAQKNYEFMLSVGMQDFSIAADAITEEKINEVSGELISRNDEISKQIIDRLNLFKSIQLDKAKDLIGSYFS